MRTTQIEVAMVLEKAVFSSACTLALCAVAIHRDWFIEGELVCCIFRPSSKVVKKVQHIELQEENIS